MNTATPSYDHCSVCNSPLLGKEADAIMLHYNCPSCGEYGVVQMYSAEDGGPSASQNDRVLLKHLLAEHRIRKLQPVMFAHFTGSATNSKYRVIAVQEFLQQYPRSPQEYFDRALENLGSYVNHPTAQFAFSDTLRAAMFCEAAQSTGMVTQLLDAGYLGFDAGGSSQHMITSKGWQRIRELQQPGRNAKQAFVAMWFGEEWLPFYTNGIKPAIEADGVTKAQRIDFKEHNGFIMDQIISEIRKSRYLVADLRKHRNGVYFEAGFAFGLGIPVIFTVPNSDKNDAHFDIQGYPHIRYDTAEELRTKLAARISATIV